MPRLDFVAEAESCSVCGSSLEVRKSRTRTVITFGAGAFQAREVHKQCGSGSWDCPIETSRELASVVPTHQRFGYDLMVHVGLARYLHRRQREEICFELREARGIEMSVGSVSALCDRFLLALEALHLKRAELLRTAISGCYPLHLDATCERGKGGLFICMDGWRQWVLLAERIETERAADLKAVVDRTVALFGDPVATLRDMGEGPAGAVVGLSERGIPDLICHYHFLAAVGGKLFEDAYALLRTIVRHTNIHADLRALLRTLRRYREPTAAEHSFGPGEVRENLLALILWIVGGEGKKDLSFPFALPHLDFVHRARRATSLADHWVPRPRSQPEWRVLHHLATVVGRLDRDHRVAAAVDRLETNRRLFCELRSVLRLDNQDLRGERPHHRVASSAELDLLRLKQIEEAVGGYKAHLEQQVAPLPPGDKKASPQSIILKYLHRYGSGLFGHPALRDVDGSILAVVPRTNNVAEQFFAVDKQQLRRRLGRAHLARDLAQRPAQAALVANLRHPDYVRIVCGSLENLPSCFSALDQQARDAASPLRRDHRDAALLRRVQALVAEAASEAHEILPTLPVTDSIGAPATEI